MLGNENYEKSDNSNYQCGTVKIEDLTYDM